MPAAAAVSSVPDALGRFGMVGGRIVTAEFPRSRVRPLVIRPAPAVLGRRIAGRRVLAVRRRGKRIVLELVGVTVIGDLLWRGAKGSGERRSPDCIEFTRRW